MLERLNQIILNRKYPPAYKRVSQARDITDLQNSAVRYMPNISEPLVLISQIQRSGGTLLSQLLDAHPQIWGHPGELHIGWPKKWNWPPLSHTEPPLKIFNLLYEGSPQKYLREGYEKSGAGREGAEGESFPMFFLSELQRTIFLRKFAEIRPQTNRAVLDLYFSTYFGAWLDYHNRYGDKKVVAAFVARLSHDTENIRKYFAVYPEGKLISILRDPYSWYASARKHGAEYENVENAMQLWMQSTQAAITNFKEFGPERVTVLRFDDLLQQTKPTMEYLSTWLGLEYDVILETPTFNGQPIKADSSYKVSQFGVISTPLKRREEIRKTHEGQYIESVASALYEEALQLVVALNDQDPDREG